MFAGLPMPALDSADMTAHALTGRITYDYFFATSDWIDPFVNSFVSATIMQTAIADDSIDQGDGIPAASEMSTVDAGAVLFGVFVSHVVPRIFS